MKVRCDFSVGQVVRVNDGVRPRIFRGKVGTILEIRNGEYGVRLGSTKSHADAVWFRREELGSEEVGQALCWPLSEGQIPSGDPSGPTSRREGPTDSLKADDG
jgi:hypothetical protein